jgi:hypothetical protein
MTVCFKSKVKTPKTDPNALKAPDPVLIDEPKGVDYGASEDDQSTETGTESLKVDRTVSDKGDGGSFATATDTGTGPVKKAPAKSNSAVKRALKKK